MKREHDAAKHDVVVEGSGNVFADLGLPSSDEDMLKVAIAHTIATVIEKRKLTQIQVAEVTGVDQARVSNLVRGRLKGFSADRLFHILLTLGRDIEVRVSKRQKNGPGRISIRA